MSERQMIYAVRLQGMGQKRFLLWRDGGAEPDTYIVLPNKKCFLVTSTLADLRREALKLGLQVKDEEPALVDIDAMMQSLAGLRDNRACSERTSCRLLDGWNGLEDLARSLDIDTCLQDVEEARLLKHVYDKLFFGNNIPAVTPRDKKYLSIFSKMERILMRRYLKYLGGKILNNNGAENGCLE